MPAADRFRVGTGSVGAAAEKMEDDAAAAEPLAARSESSRHAHTTGRSEKLQNLSVASEPSESPSGEPRGAKEPPEGGLLAWLVVFASFIVHVCVLGMQYSAGVFIVPYTRAFNVGRGAVSVVSTIATVLFPLAGALVGAVADRWGYRKVVAVGGVLFCAGFAISASAQEVWHLYLTQGLIVGLGASALYFPSVSVVSQWFKKRRRGLAVGLAVSGSGVGNFAFAPLIEALIASQGWRNALLVITALNAGLLSVAVGFLRRRLVPPPPPPGPDGAPARRPPLFDLSLLRMRNFRLLYLATATGQLGNLMPFAHVSPFAQDYGMSASYGAILVSILGAGSAAGRVLLGLVADRWGPVPVLRLAMLVNALAMLAWPWCTAPPALAAFCALYGFTGGGFISLLPVVSAELFGVERLARAVGLLFTSFGVANAVGSPLAGFLFDATGSYTPAILAFSACMFVSVGFLLFVRVERPAGAAVAPAPAPPPSAGEGAPLSSFSSSGSALKPEPEPGAGLVPAGGDRLQGALPPDGVIAASLGGAPPPAPPPVKAPATIAV
eukprot:tig00021254_g19721.t1